MPISERDAHARPPAYCQVNDLSAGYGRVPTISGVSISAGIGEVVAIVGPNGAGKSTLLKALAGVLPMMSGQVMLGDEEVTGLPSFQLARRGMGYVPQLDDVFEPLSVAENLAMGGYALPRQAIDGRVKEVVAIFPQLEALLGRSARKLSGGERKMVAVGRALMARPRVLLLDEPTANLSPKLAATLLGSELRALAASGVAVLLVEQRAAAALRVADWAYVMVSGHVSLSAPAASLATQGNLGDIFMGAGVSGDLRGAR